MKPAAFVIAVFYSAFLHAQSTVVIEIGRADGESVATVFSDLFASRYSTFNPVTGTAMQTMLRFTSTGDGFNIRCVTRYAYSTGTTCQLRFDVSKSNEQLEIFRTGENSVTAVFRAPAEVRALSRKAKPEFTTPQLHIACSTNECHLEAH